MVKIQDLLNKFTPSPYSDKDIHKNRECLVIHTWHVVCLVVDVDMTDADHAP